MNLKKKIAALATAFTIATAPLAAQGSLEEKAETSNANESTRIEIPYNHENISEEQNQNYSGQSFNIINIQPLTTIEGNLNLLELERPIRNNVINPYVDYFSKYSYFPDFSLNSYFFIKETSFFMSDLIPKSSISDLENILDGVRTNRISSYEGLLSESRNLSEQQKLALIAGIAQKSEEKGYEPESSKNPIDSQEEYFKNLQAMLNNKDIVLGVCSQIAHYGEQLADDLGIESSAVRVSSSGNHRVTISDLENGTAITDYGTTRIWNTKNIEEILRAYQKIKISPKLEHDFIDDGKFAYQLIPQEGREFLEFNNYDESSETTRQRLLQVEERVMGTRISSQEGDYISSRNIQYSTNRFGILGGVGVIENIPGLDRMTLFNIGGDIDVSFSYLNLSADLDMTTGTPNREFEDTKNLFGASGQIILSTKRDEGLNLTIRRARNLTVLRDDIFDLPENIRNARNLTVLTKNIFYLLRKGVIFDLLKSEAAVVTSDNKNLEIGASYSVNSKRIFPGTITPYGVYQLSLQPTGGDNSFGFIPTETTIGTRFELDLNSGTLSFDPHYVRKVGTHEFAGELSYENSNFSFGLNGSADLSTYTFAPDRYTFGLNATANIGRFDTKLGLERQITDWNGERESQTNLNFGISY